MKERSEFLGKPDPGLLAALRRQQVACTVLGSSYYADLLGHVISDVEAGGPCAAAMAGPWPSDPFELAVPLRFLGALHRLLLDGSEPNLVEWWPPREMRAPPSIRPELARLVSTHLARITSEMGAVVQTNEVGRLAALAGGFLTVAREAHLPLRLLEVGTSAGLHLRWDHFHYVDRGTSWGTPTSSVRIDGDYDGGSTPFEGSVTIAERSGCDLSPLDVHDAEDCLRLRSFVWPDQRHRLERLDRALEVARSVSAEITTMSADEWLPSKLAEPAEGVATVVFHSIVWQYLPDEVRDQIRSAILEAGGRASATAPIAWLRLEPSEMDPKRAALELTSWPNGSTRVLALAGFHGSPITWMD